MVPHKIYDKKAVYIYESVQQCFFPDDSHFWHWQCTRHLLHLQWLTPSKKKKWIQTKKGDYTFSSPNQAEDIHAHKIRAPESEVSKTQVYGYGTGAASVKRSSNYH